MGFEEVECILEMRGFPCLDPQEPFFGKSSTILFSLEHRTKGADSQPFCKTVKWILFHGKSIFVFSYSFAI